jgi:hypothetical protein
MPFYHDAMQPSGDEKLFYASSSLPVTSSSLEPSTCYTPVGRQTSIAAVMHKTVLVMKAGSV